MTPNTPANKPDTLAFDPRALRDAFGCSHQENSLSAWALPGVMCPASIIASVEATWARIWAMAPSLSATR